MKIIHTTNVKKSNIFAVSILEAVGNPAFLCVLGSRMLFNLIEAAEREQNEGTSYDASASSSRTLTEMGFTWPTEAH